MSPEENEILKEESAIRYLLGEMSPTEESDFAAGISQDPDLRSLVASIADALGSAVGELPLFIPPPELREQVLAAASPTLAIFPATRRNRRLQKAWPGFAAAAAMALFAAVGWTLWLQATTREKNSRAEVVAVTAERDGIAARNSELEKNLAIARSANDLAEIRIASLRSELKQAYVATLAWSQKRQEGVLDLSQLPLNQAGQSYQLWIVDENNTEPISAGAFEIDATGKMRVPFSPVMAVHNPVAFAISVERAGGVPKREGPIIVSQGM